MFRNSQNSQQKPQKTPEQKPSVKKYTIENFSGIPDVWKEVLLNPRGTLTNPGKLLETADQHNAYYTGKKVNILEVAREMALEPAEFKAVLDKLPKGYGGLKVEYIKGLISQIASCIGSQREFACDKSIIFQLLLALPSKQITEVVKAVAGRVFDQAVTLWVDNKSNACNETLAVFAGLINSCPMHKQDSILSAVVKESSRLNAVLIHTKQKQPCFENESVKGNESVRENEIVTENESVTRFIDNLNSKLGLQTAHSEIRKNTMVIISKKMNGSFEIPEEKTESPSPSLAPK